MSTIESNKTILRRFYEEAWNQKNLAILQETHAPDWTHHDPSNPNDLGDGPQGNQKRMTEVIAAFPDICFDVGDMIAEEDRVAVRLTIRGTHQGTFAGMPATGRQIAVQSIIIHRLRDGKIIEDWMVRDTLGLLQQLGVMPAPGASGG